MNQLTNKDLFISDPFIQDGSHRGVNFLHLQNTRTTETLIVICRSLNDIGAFFMLAAALEITSFEMKSKHQSFSRVEVEVMAFRGHEIEWINSRSEFLQKVERK